MRLNYVLSIIVAVFLGLTGCQVQQPSSETDTNYPITVMLKDNSTEEYVYKDTKIPEEDVILTNVVDKDGKHELMIDFNEIDVFNFDVFIVNK